MLQRFGLLTTFLLAVAIISWEEIKQRQRVPQPQRFVFAALVWGGLGIASSLGVPELATVFGIGYVLALAYRQRQVIGGSARSTVDHQVPGEEG